MNEVFLINFCKYDLVTLSDRTHLILKDLCYSLRSRFKNTVKQSGCLVLLKTAFVLFWTRIIRHQVWTHNLSVRIMGAVLNYELSRSLRLRKARKKIRECSFNNGTSVITFYNVVAFRGAPENFLPWFISVNEIRLHIAYSPSFQIIHHITKWSVYIFAPHGLRKKCHHSFPILAKYGILSCSRLF